jgi:hypothetical protein
MKTCTKCLEKLPLSQFSKKSKSPDGLQPNCKLCVKKYLQNYYIKNKHKRSTPTAEERGKNKLRCRKYYYQNRTHLKKVAKNWREANQQKMREYSQKYRQINSSQLKERQKLYYDKNKKRILLSVKQRTKERNLTDPKFRIGSAMGKALSKALAGKKAGQKWETLVGYTVTDLMAHLEPQFTPEMTWDNYGSYWHLDHLVPQYYFEYDSYEHPHFKACWSLDNLQPLEAEKNLRKNRHVIQL